MSIPQRIIDLVEDFEENKHEYTNPEIFDEIEKKVRDELMQAHSSENNLCDNED